MLLAAFALLSGASAAGAARDAPLAPALEARPAAPAPWYCHDLDCPKFKLLVGALRRACAGAIARMREPAAPPRVVRSPAASISIPAACRCRCDAQADEWCARLPASRARRTT